MSPAWPPGLLHDSATARVTGSSTGAIRVTATNSPVWPCAPRSAQVVSIICVPAFSSQVIETGWLLVVVEEGLRGDDVVAGREDEVDDDALTGRPAGCWTRLKRWSAYASLGPRGPVAPVGRRSRRSPVRARGSRGALGARRPGGTRRSRRPRRARLPGRPAAVRGEVFRLARALRLRSESWSEPALTWLLEVMRTPAAVAVPPAARSSATTATAMAGLGRSRDAFMGRASRVEPRRSSGRRPERAPSARGQARWTSNVITPRTPSPSSDSVISSVSS